MSFISLEQAISWYWAKTNVFLYATMLLVDVTIPDIRIYCTRNLFSNVFVTWKCNVDSVRINSSLVEQKYSFYSQQLLESDCSNTKTERLVLNSFCFWFFPKAWFLDQFLLNLGKDWETHLFPFNYFISLFPIPFQIVPDTLQTTLVLES